LIFPFTDKYTAAGVKKARASVQYPEGRDVSGGMERG
jgi:hypothetical protein